MENQYSIHLKVSKVENGQFLAESDDIPGLVAQGRTISEAVEIARDVARKLMADWELAVAGEEPFRIAPLQ